jgi:hypothetical protein
MQFVGVQPGEPAGGGAGADPHPVSGPRPPLPLMRWQSRDLDPYLM